MRRFLFLAIGLALAFPAIVQCEDPAARQRADAGARLNELAATYEGLGRGPNAAGSDEFQQHQARLQKLLSDLKGVRGEGGQAAAAGLLTASVQGDLAMLALAEAEAVETELRAERWLVHGHVDAATRLRALAAGRKAIDLAPVLAGLDESARRAEGERQAYQAEMKDLSGPIEELTTGNQSDQQDVDRLQAQVSDLRKQASALGPRDGFPRLEQAIAIQRQADEVESRMAHREIDLDYELRPEHDLAETRVEHAQALLETVARARGELDAFESAAESDAAATEERVRSLTAAIDQHVKSIEEKMGGDLEGRYEEALGQLDQAVSAAERAAGADRDLSDAARLSAARLHTMRGRVLLTRLHGLADQRSLLRELAGAGEVVSGAERYQTALTGLDKTVEQATQGARDAYGQAHETIGKVKDRSAQDAIARLAERLSVVTAGLGGPALPLSLPGAEGSADAAGAAPQDGREPAPEGAAPSANATHQALMELMLAGDPRAARYLMARTPLGRTMVRIAQATAPVLEAAAERFGASNLAGQFGGLPPSSVKPELASETEDTAVYRMSVGAESLDLTLRKQKDGWYFDYDPVAQLLSGAAGQQGDPKAFLAMFQQQMTVLEQQAPALAEAVRGGKFQSADEVLAELMRIMAGAAGAGAQPPG